jgi:hypothetical protein
MLRSHLNAIESVLLAQSTAASNAGHPNIRGGPREWFIRDFLISHLPENLQIGQGEIIDPDSKPNPNPKQYRHQVDIILYRKDLPKISLSQNDHIFLAEGVMATIEVKSKLKEKGKGSLEQTCNATIAHRKLKRNLPAHAMGGGWRPEHIVPYMIVFDGPAKISTVAHWLPKICKRLNCKPNSIVEMIVVLGKGAVWRIDAFPGIKYDEGATKDKIWAFVEQPEHNLFLFFVHMLNWMGWASAPPNGGFGDAPHIYRLQNK